MREGATLGRQVSGRSVWFPLMKHTPSSTDQRDNNAQWAAQKEINKEKIQTAEKCLMKVESHQKLIEAKCVCVGNMWGPYSMSFSLCFLSFFLVVVV